MRLVWLAIIEMAVLGAFVPLAGAKEPADGTAQVGVEGVYRIVEHRETSDCSLPEEQWAQGDEQGGLFRLTKRGAGGSSLLCWSECSAPDRCDDVCLSNRLFRSKDGRYQCDSFEYEEFVKTPDGSICTVGPGLAVLEQTVHGVRWRESISTVSIDTGDVVLCDTDLTRGLEQMLECRSVRIFEAQRIK